RGEHAMYVPDAEVLHAGSASLGRRSDFALYHGHRNIVWTFVKNMPAPLLLMYLPQHLMWNVASLCALTLAGRGGVIARAKMAALRGLAAALRQRSSIQK